MSQWIERLWDSLLGERARPRRRVLRRRCSISGPAMAWLNDPARTEPERWEFAEMLLRLDADPVGEPTRPLLGPGCPPGLRWTTFAGRTAIYEWDPGENRVRIVKCL